jgi:hypothetical protein
MPGLRNFSSVLLIVADAAAIKTASEITARVCEVLVDERSGRFHLDAFEKQL